MSHDDDTIYFARAHGLDVSMVESDDVKTVKAIQKHPIHAQEGEPLVSIDDLASSFLSLRCILFDMPLIMLPCASLTRNRLRDL